MSADFLFAFRQGLLFLVDAVERELQRDGVRIQRTAEVRKAYRSGADPKGVEDGKNRQPGVEGLKKAGR